MREDTRYKVTGIFLLLLAILFFFADYRNTFLNALLEDFRIFAILRVMLGFTLLPIFIIPRVILPLILVIPGIMFIWLGWKRKEANKVLHISAKAYFISLILLVISFLAGWIPCSIGKPDGFCMLYGILLSVTVLIAWLIGSISFLIGILMLRRKS